MGSVLLLFGLMVVTSCATQGKECISLRNAIAEFRAFGRTYVRGGTDDRSSLKTIADLLKALDKTIGQIEAGGVGEGNASRRIVECVGALKDDSRIMRSFQELVGQRVALLDKQNELDAKSKEASARLDNAAYGLGPQDQRRAVAVMESTPEEELVDAVNRLRPANRNDGRMQKFKDAANYMASIGQEYKSVLTSMEALLPQVNDTAQRMDIAGDRYNQVCDAALAACGGN